MVCDFYKRFHIFYETGLFRAYPAFTQYTASLYYIYSEYACVECVCLVECRWSVQGNYGKNTRNDLNAARWARSILALQDHSHVVLFEKSSSENKRIWPRRNSARTCAHFCCTAPIMCTISQLRSHLCSSRQTQHHRTQQNKKQSTHWENLFARPFARLENVARVYADCVFFYLRWSNFVSLC